MNEEREALLRELNSALIVFPHERIGQLIFNALDHSNHVYGTSVPLYYITDVELTRALREYVVQFGGSHE